ncbi:transporter substrate-binding domain-containing protein [Salininema proteolyticum]|uniref:Transporter substrate-binding domain-containing protein n=1 Tax=Salininema proteolyticum TaxID=1607685 RepID=A0ABV8U4E6_9ACTN
MSFKRLTAGAGVAAAALTGLTACGSDGDDNALTVCTNVPFAPFEERSGDDIVGFDADMMQLLADRTDRELSWVEVDFAAIESGSAFLAGTCDIAAAGITITDERQEALGMSDPYFRADQALATTTDSDVASVDDLEGKRVGVQTATTGESYAEDLEEEKGLEVVKFDDMGSVANAMKAGSVDASIADLSNWNSFAEGESDFTVAEELPTEEYYGYAVKKDDDELLGEVNDMIAAALESGEYEKIYREWIGVEYSGQLESAE